MIQAACSLGLAGNWREAMRTPALLILLSSGQQAAGGGQQAGKAKRETVWRDNGDGSRSCSFGSIEELAAMLPAGYVRKGS